MLMERGAEMANEEAVVAAAADASEEEEERQQRKRRLEEALEVKSLRRIISAYLNYSDAAEEDVRRYERSFRKLPPAHKALLSHLPLKFQRLKRCISLNSFFILNMLQAFDPPLDMGQDMDICENEDLENGHKNCIQLETGNFEEKNLDFGQHASTSGRAAFSESEKPGCKEGNDMTKSTERTGNEEIWMESVYKSDLGSLSVRSELNAEVLSADGNHDVKHVNNWEQVRSVPTANGNVDPALRDWLDPSLQLRVPLVDVDKVRCIIRNIVRDWAPEGQRERDQCYKPILEELDRLFPSRCKTRPPCCLVPGAGLGRLALDISCLGFISQGNEFSYYMMICSSFILNQLSSPFLLPSSVSFCVFSSTLCAIN